MAEADATKALPDPVMNLAREKFGIQALSPWQRFAVANTLERLNQLVILPTGGGKSICFHLPALLLPGVTLAVMPLLSLLKDQQRRLSARGIPCEVLRGGQDAAERRAIMERLALRASKIVLTVPEMLATPRVLQQLRAVGVDHLVVDEAHCISEWGTSFRPSYCGIGPAAAALGEPVISAYTATASPRIIRDIDLLLFQGRPWSRTSELPDRPNIFYRVFPVLSKIAALEALLREAARPLVIFTRSRSGAELTARLLRNRLRTDDVYFYHAGLEREERRRVEEWFFPSITGVLCATSAYGMGIDKPDIRTVIHRDVPLSLEAYMQESGRAGRDGEPAQAILLHGGEDRTFASGLEDAVERERYSLALEYASPAAGCRRRFLLSTLGEGGIDCAGCDLCAGEASGEPPGLDVILSVLRRSPRRYTKRQLIALLAGRESAEAQAVGLVDRYGYGSLCSWRRDDIEEAVESLEGQGLIRAPRRGFFRHRYVAWDPENRRSTGREKRKNGAKDQGPA